MKRVVLTLISQKIKKTKLFFVGAVKSALAFLKNKRRTNFFNDVTHAEVLEEKRIIKPIDELSAKKAMEYLLKTDDSFGALYGVGLVVQDVSGLKNINTLIDTLINKFRYLTIYTENLNSASHLADLVYEKYGLPIMLITQTEADKCRYPFKIDLNLGKIKYGQNTYVDGAEYDEAGSIIGLCFGKRIVKV